MSVNQPPSTSSTRSLLSPWLARWRGTADEAGGSEKGTACEVDKDGAGGEGREGEGGPGSGESAMALRPNYIPICCLPVPVGEQDDSATAADGSTEIGMSRETM